MDICKQDHRAANLDLHQWHRICIAFASPVHEFLQISTQVLKHLQHVTLTLQSHVAPENLQLLCVSPYQIQARLVVLLHMLDT